MLTFFRVKALQLRKVLFDALVALPTEQVFDCLFGRHVLRMLLFLRHKVTYG